MIPDWLPAELTLNGSHRDDISTLYNVYKRDFIVGPPAIVDGYRVIVNNIPDPSWNKEYTFEFTHIITSDSGSLRQIDYDRAKKLPWVRSIIENYAQPEVVGFWYRQPKKDKLYLWLRDHDFVVILTPYANRRITSVGNKVIIVTAFSIYPYRRHDFDKLLKKSFRVL